MKPFDSVVCHGWNTPSYRSGIWYWVSPFWRIRLYDEHFETWWASSTTDACGWNTHYFPEHITTLEDKKEYALAIWRLES